MRMVSLRAALMGGAAALALDAAPAGAEDFTNFIVFGDSLADTGQFPDPARLLNLNPALPETSRLRFTNRLSDGQYGQPYTQVLSTKLGFGAALPSQPISIDAATAAALGVQSATSTADGLNYAVGGNRTDQVRSSVDGTPANDGGVGAITRAGVVGLPSAFDGNPANDPFAQDAVAPAFLASADAARLPGALVVVSAGGNDIRDVANVSVNQAGMIDPAFTTLSTDSAANIAAMQAAAANTVAAVRALVDGGAGLVVVPNLPDLGMVPENQADIGAAAQALMAGGTGNAAIDAILAQITGVDPVTGQALTLLPRLRSEATAAYNAALAQGLAGIDGNVLPVDFQTFFNAAVADPARFGFSPTIDHANTCFNGREATLIPCVEDPTLSFNSGVDANGDGINDNANPLPFIFNDGLHPSTSAHAAAADLIAAFLSAPDSVTVLPQIGISAARFASDAAEDQLSAGVLSGPGLAPFIAVGASRAQLDLPGNAPRHDAAAYSGLLGLTYALGNGISVGGGLGYQFLDTDAAGSTTEIEGDAFLAVLFAGLDRGWIFGNATATYGFVNYDEITRRSRVGVANLRNTGEADAHVHGLTAEIGARLYQQDGVSLGPMVSAEYWHADVDGYTEGGDAASALRFGDIEADSLRGGIGAFLEAQGTPSGIPVFFRAEGLYEHEFHDDAVDVGLGLAGGGTSASFEGYEPGEDGVALNLEFGAVLHGVTATLGYNMRLHDNDEDHGIRLGATMPF